MFGIKSKKKLKLFSSFDIIFYLSPICLVYYSIYLYLIYRKNIFIII
jgi:hypothetical protein